MTSDWMTLCAEQLPDVGRLAAFDRHDTDVGCPTWESLLARCEGDLAALPIEATLATEVDAAQAALFARRFHDVAHLLAAVRSPAAAALRVGLIRRTAEVLRAPAPRALRVRAVADYFYSQAAIETHRDGPFATWEQRIHTAPTVHVAEGITHVRLVGAGPIGPVHVNVLTVRGRELCAIDPRPEGNLVDLVRDQHAVAGVSGGFFLYSEPDIAVPCLRTDPVGLLVTDGVVVQPPVFPRAALVQDPDGRVHVDRLALVGCTGTVGSTSFTVANVNRPGPGPTAWTRAHADEAPADGWQIAGRVVHGRGRRIPVGGLVLTGVDLQPGALTWTLKRPVQQAMAGGPMLLGEHALDLAIGDFTAGAPPITFSRDETYDQNLLPRMGAGLRDDGTLVFAAVDGRDLHHAPGLTLAGTAQLLRALGCTTALNLDGGSSKRMVVGDRVVDRPSTEVVTEGTRAAIRPVHTALLVR